MKLKQLLMFVSLMLVALEVNSTIVQKIFLKNGSELCGYISMHLTAIKYVNKFIRAYAI